MTKLKLKHKLNRIEIADPIFIMYKGEGDDILCQVHKPKGWTHEHYGIMICDLVRHVAQGFKVPEAQVWEWVDRERFHQTGPVTEIKGFDDSSH